MWSHSQLQLKIIFLLSEVTHTVYKFGAIFKDFLWNMIWCLNEYALFLDILTHYYTYKFVSWPDLSVMHYIINYRIYYRGLYVSHVCNKFYNVSHLCNKVVPDLHYNFSCVFWLFLKIIWKLFLNVWYYSITEVTYIIEVITDVTYIIDPCNGFYNL